MRIAIFAETFLPKWDGVATTSGYLLEHLADLTWNPGSGYPMAAGDTRSPELPL
jgi:hypothetical protein